MACITTRKAPVPLYEGRTSLSIEIVHDIAPAGDGAGALRPGHHLPRMERVGGAGFGAGKGAAGRRLRPHRGSGGGGPGTDASWRRRWTRR